MERRSRGAAALLSGVGILAVAACGATTASSGSAGRERLHQQADQALARYATAVRSASAQGFVPVGDLTSQIGDWELSVGENNKIALLTGQLSVQGTLPPAPPTAGQVVWQDGSSRSVSLMSARDALLQLKGAVESTGCGGCEPLQVIGAELVTQSVQTSRGLAQTPVWAFSIVGTHVRVTRVAVRPEEAVIVTPPPWDSNNPPSGIAIDGASLAADGVTLTVTFVGSPAPANRPCGADYTAEPVESDTAVVVIVYEQSAGGDEGCRTVGAMRTARAVLSRPLSNRAVLEVRQGAPVPVTNG